MDEQMLEFCMLGTVIYGIRSLWKNREWFTDM